MGRYRLSCCVAEAMLSSLIWETSTFQDETKRVEMQVVFPRLRSFPGLRSLPRVYTSNLLSLNQKYNCCITFKNCLSIPQRTDNFPSNLCTCHCTVEKCPTIRNSLDFNVACDWRWRFSILSFLIADECVHSLMVLASGEGLPRIALKVFASVDLRLSMAQVGIAVF
jgi:hypothetical protein